MCVHESETWTTNLMPPEIYHIELSCTTPYHPQTNECIERLHGTLESLLSKANTRGLDWESFLPLAVQCLRVCPNRDTGFSPAELVLGHNIRTPLDLLYDGWVDDSCGGMELGEWVDSLRERLEMLWDSATDIGLKEREKREEAYNRGKIVRTFEVGNRILCRIPGMIAKLQDSWEGPYEVLERLGPVNYKVREEGEKQRTKVIHVNNAKLYVERGKVTVYAEEGDLFESGVVLGDTKCAKVNEGDLGNLLREFSDVLSGKPGNCGLAKVNIEVMEDVTPIAQNPYRIPNKVKDGVQEEIKTLLQEGIIKESSAPWASPLVPIVKPKGKIRLCVDFRKVNQVTQSVPYLMPQLEDILERAGKAKVLSKIDLAKGFYQLVVDETSRDVTFCSPYGNIVLSIYLLD